MKHTRHRKFMYTNLRTYLLFNIEKPMGGHCE